MVRSIGLEIRAGLHAGEIEVVGEDVGGMAVHIGARIAAAAGGGEVLASSTVRDLLAGSGIGFEDRGEHELKGVPRDLAAVCDQGILRRCRSDARSSDAWIESASHSVPSLGELN